MLISQVLFWLSIMFAIISPMPELMNILILTFCQSLSWILLITVMVKEGKITIQTSIADGLVVLMIVVFGLATLLSKNHWLSFWGQGASIAYSFISFLILALTYFYVRLTLHAIKEQKSVHCALISIITLIGWYSFAGQFIKLPLAGMIGGSLLVSQIFLLISLITFLIAGLSKQSRLMTIISGLVVALDLIALVITNATSLLLIILLFLLMLIILPISKKITQHVPSLVIIFGIATIILAAILLPVRTWLDQAPLVAINLPWLMHWPIIKGVIAESALFGYGLGNFSTAFYAFKPLSFNLLPFFNLGFTQARSLPVELLTTTGLLGFGSATAFVVSILILAWRRMKAIGETYEHYLLYGWIVMVLASIIIVPTMSLLILIMITAAIIVNKPQLFESSIHLHKSLKLLLLYGGVLGIIIGAYYLIHFKSASLYLFSIDDNELHQVQLIPQAKRAITLLPHEMEHRVTYANLLMVKNKDIAPDDVLILQELYQTAIPLARSFDDISLLASSMNIYVNRTQDTQVPMSDLLNRMMTMDPNNPYYPYQRALSYVQQAQSLYLAEQKVKPYDQILTALTSAESELTKAVELKNNYQEAKDLLDQIKEVQKQIEAEQKAKVKK